METLKAIIVLGYPGSGKTKYVEDVLKPDASYQVLDYAKIARNHMGRIHNGLFKEVSLAVDAEYTRGLYEAIHDGSNLVLVNKYEEKLYRKGLIDVLRSYGYEIEVIVLDKSIEECKARNNARKHHTRIDDCYFTMHVRNFVFFRHSSVMERESKETPFKLTLVK